MNSVPDGVILANSPETLLDALSESEQLLAQRAPVLSLKKYDLYAERSTSMEHRYSPRPWPSSTSFLERNPESC